ncbi:cytochrome P450 [Aspergillus pseudodeflectus]|uniref:Cytochrome P450 n=1 Tax=Aspergillus pseudodeflectus TaxID=176178 RepID=A0ABR4JV82_9EURO
MLHETTSLAPLGQPWIAGLVVVSAVLYLLYSTQRWRPNNLPLLNDAGPFDFLQATAVNRFRRDARQLIKSGFDSHKDVFAMRTDVGVEMFASPEYADQFRNHPSLKVFPFTAKMHHGHLPGFELCRSQPVEDRILIESVRTQLAQSLGKLIQPLASDIGQAISDRWPSESGWEEIALGSVVERTIAQGTSSVYCLDTAWPEFVVKMEMALGMASAALSAWPVMLRRIVAKFLPECLELYRTMDAGRELMSRDMRRRTALQASTGEAPLNFFEWFKEASHGEEYDELILNLRIAFASMHGLCDHLVKILLRLSEDPQLVDNLRKEVIQVYKSHGWSKTALYHLKLMDSAFKEVQRVDPILFAVGRLAVDDVTLKDGLVIRKGQSIRISGHTMWDEDKYPDAAHFDAYRFYKLRQAPGQENTAQFTSPTSDHLGFGYGGRACPGRFFAAAVLKISLCHVLMKYDIKPADGETGPHVWEFAAAINANMAAKVLVRRRQPEIQL